MPYQGGWYIPKKVIEARLSGKVDANDIMVHTDFLVEILDEAVREAPNQNLYLLLDCMDVESMPAIYRLISTAAPVMRFRDRMGPMFLITKNKKVKSILEITAHVMNFQLFVFDNREDTLQALNAVVNKDHFQAGAN